MPRCKRCGRIFPDKKGMFGRKLCGYCRSGNEYSYKIFCIYHKLENKYEINKENCEACTNALKGSAYCVEMRKRLNA
jgi:hypothetical protein